MVWMCIKEEQWVETQKTELPQKKKRGEPQWKFMHVVKKDMKIVGVTEEDERYRF